MERIKAFGIYKKILYVFPLKMAAFLCDEFDDYLSLRGVLNILSRGFGLSKSITSQESIVAQPTAIPWFTYPAIIRSHQCVPLKISMNDNKREGLHKCFYQRTI